MRDLTEQLRAIAATPSAGPNMARIAALARRRRHRRWASEATTLAVAFAVAASGPWGVFQPAPPPEILDDPALPVPTVVTPEADDARDPRALDPLHAPPSHAVSVDATAAAPPPDATPSSLDATPTAPSTTGTATTSPEPGADASPAPGHTGAPEPSPTPAATTRPPSGCRAEWDPCTFIATASGGFEADGGGDWAVTVVRDGEQTVYLGWQTDAQWCRDDVIQPGDEVTVDPSVGTDETAGGGVFWRGFTYVAAGEGYGCN